MSGCKTCFNAYSDMGELQCRIAPHDYKTILQRQIVEWLSNVGRRPATDAGCPGWKNDSVATSAAEEVP